MMTSYGSCRACALVVLAMVWGLPMASAQQPTASVTGHVTCGDTQPAKAQPTGLFRFSVPDTVRSYEDGKQSVIVTDSDVVGLNIELTPSKNTKPGVNVNDLLKQ